MRFAVPVLAAALVVAAGSGCSSDDDDGGPDAAGTTTAVTTPAATRPEPPEDQTRWAKQVDEACNPWQERIDAVAPPIDAGGLDAWLAETLPLVRKQLAAVRGVKPPAKKSEAERAALFVGALEKLERALTRYHAALKSGDAEEIEAALVETNAAGASARGYAVSLDITQCGGYEDR